MLNLTTDRPETSGFYFVSFYTKNKNSIEPFEIFLEKLKVTNEKEVIVEEENDNMDDYPEALFSTQLPEYLTAKFSRIVNEIMKPHRDNFKISMAVNDAVGYDETFSVFISVNENEPAVHIVTQHISGNVDQMVIRGNDSVKALAALL